jgi:preprotein translocase subunit SecD
MISAGRHELPKVKEINMGSRSRQRIIGIAVVIVVALLLLVPTISKEGFGREIQWPLSRALSLGLDLRGGVHLVYQVATEEAVKGHLQTTAQSARSVLRAEKLIVVRSNPVDANRLEVVLLSDSMTERARAVIEDKFPELQFVEKTADGGRPRLVYHLPDQTARQIKERSVVQAIETLRNRVDQFGVAEPLITRSGVERILLQMPGFSDIERVKRVVGKTAKLEFRLVPVSPSARSLSLKDRKGSPIRVEEDVLMGGDAVQDARPERSTGRVEVVLTLTAEGRKTFGAITSEHVGRQLAIVLDGVVYSDPVIQDRITQGVATISGTFSLEDAQELSVVLRAGALSAPLIVAEERTVGPSLGAESIRSGIVAIVVGFLAIAVFMIGYYRKAGLVAVFTLAMNLFLLVASLAFGATLTLPGLAGLALTVGMAVDSNVLIFERIRDEIRLGAQRDSAVRGGFDKASSAILDTNLTGFLSGVVLYLFGTGPIKGFAVTLMAGVLTTLFCAVVLCKFVFEAFPLRDRSGRLSV